MSLLQQTPDINYQPSALFAAIAKLSKIKLSSSNNDNDEYKTYYIRPINVDATGLDNLLHGTLEYRTRVVSQLGLQEEGELYQTWINILEGAVQEAAERVISNDTWNDVALQTFDNDNKMGDRFNAFVNDVIDDLTKNESGQVFAIAWEHLTRAKLEDTSLNAKEAQQRIETLMRLMKFLRRPAGKQFPSAKEWMEVYYNSMPEAWQNQFVQVPRSITSDGETLTTIQQFMTMCETADAAKKKSAAKKSSSQRSDNEDGDGNGRRSRKNKRRGNNKDGRSNKRNRNNANKTFHNKCGRAGCKGKTEHEWKNCFFNRDGDNYRPELSENKNRNKREYRGNNRREENHHVDDNRSRSNRNRDRKNSEDNEMHHIDEPIPRKKKRPTRLTNKRTTDDSGSDSDDESLFGNPSAHEEKMMRDYLEFSRKQKNRRQSSPQM